MVCPSNKPKLLLKESNKLKPRIGNAFKIAGYFKDMDQDHLMGKFKRMEINKEMLLQKNGEPYGIKSEGKPSYKVIKISDIEFELHKI